MQSIMTMGEILVEIMAERKGQSFRAPGPLERATLSEGTRRAAVPLAGDGVHDRPPIADSRWSNEAIVTREMEP